MSFVDRIWIDSRFQPASGLMTLYFLLLCSSPLKCSVFAFGKNSLSYWRIGVLSMPKLALSRLNILGCRDLVFFRHKYKFLFKGLLQKAAAKTGLCLRTLALTLQGLYN